MPLLTIYKYLIRSHLHYADIIYDQAYKTSVHQKIQSVHYNSTLAIASTIGELCSGWAFSELFKDRWGPKKATPSLKSVTYLRMKKLDTVISYLKKIQKYLNHVTHSLRSPNICIFTSEIRKFCYIKKCRYRLYFDT